MLVNVLSRVSKSSSICCGVVVDIDLSETKQAERKPSQAGPSLAHGRLAGTVLTSRLLAPGSVSNIYIYIYCSLAQWGRMSVELGCLHWETAVYCARCRGRRGAPSGEACGSSRRAELRGRVGLSRSLQRCVAVDHNRPAERGIVVAAS